MEIAKALKFVNAEIERIELKNADKELRPWMPKPCADALVHWSRVQQRLALNGRSPHKTLCCAEFNLEAPARSAAQKKAAEASAERLRAKRAQKAA